MKTRAEELTTDLASHPTPVIETPRASTSAASTPTPVADEHPSDASSDVSTSAGRPKRVRKPAARLREILDGRAVVGNRQGVAYTRGVQLPTPETSSVPAPGAEKPLEAEGEGDWVMMAADFADEYAMATEISEVEALEPQNLREAKSRPDWPLWEKAIEEELRMLQETETWTLVEPPEGANVVGSKWVFRAKKDAAGNVVRYKGSSGRAGIFAGPWGRLFRHICARGTPGVNPSDFSARCCSGHGNSSDRHQGRISQRETHL